MCKLFADDCKIYGVVDMPSNTSTIHSDLNDLSNWSEYLFDEVIAVDIAFGRCELVV